MMSNFIGPCILISFLLGMGAGWSIHAFDKHEVKKEEIKITELEKIIDRSTCEAMMIDAIIRERMRLTGKPNP